jgi:hypothetical protein
MRSSLCMYVYEEASSENGLCMKGEENYAGGDIL